MAGNIFCYFTCQFEVQKYRRFIKNVNREIFLECFGVEIFLECFGVEIFLECFGVAT